MPVTQIKSHWYQGDLVFVARTANRGVVFGLDTDGTSTVNTDVTIYGSASSNKFVWDASADMLDLDGIEVRLQDADDLSFGDGSDAQIRWSTGDADNHSFVVALGDTSQSLHVTDKAAIATDWNVGSDTHPTLYVHSNTTPASDYVKIGAHDGSAAWSADMVGGGTLNLGFDGLEALVLAETASAVNHVQITNAATGSSAEIAGAGDDTNVGIVFDTKGAGLYEFQFGTVSGLRLHDADSNFAGAADTAGHSVHALMQNGGLASADTSGVAGADLTVRGGDGSAGGTHTANNPDGGDGGNLVLASGAAGAAGPGGSGVAGDEGWVKIQAGTTGASGNNGLLQSLGQVSVTTAGNVTYTSAQFRNGTIHRDPNGANRTDTTPTAASLVSLVPGASIGETVHLWIVNTADAAETITLSAGAGVTLRGGAGQAFGQNTAKHLFFRFTNVTPASEAVDLISE